MFSIHPFIDYSVVVLRSQTSEAGVAKTCMQLLTKSIETLDHKELCRQAETAFAIAAAKRFAGLSEKITSVHTPLLKAIVEPFEKF